MMSSMAPGKKKQLEQDDSEPMTATRRLLAGLRDGKMADLELVGDDGIRVPALRCVLACASPVMHNLLYGDPSQSTQSVVKISGCSNKTLKALVEYCCSDELNASIWDGSCPPAEIVKDIVALARVSHTYGIPNMEERVLEGINPLMGAIPPLACVVFNYADPATTKAIHKSAITLIREKPYTCLQQEGQNVGGMVCLSPDKLKELICDQALQVDELFLFKQLVRWRSYNRNVYANATAVCKKLVSYIDLTYIDPGDIKAFVLDAGLYEDKAIIEALLEQAISATREGLAFAAMRGNTNGKQQVYAMVQGSGNADCNGFYKQVHREGTLLCYGKIIDEKRMILLVKDSHTSWKICDNESIFYEWKSSNESHHDQFPVSGWVSVPSRAQPQGGAASRVPTVKWFRPRGSTPRLPTRPPASIPAYSAPPPSTTRIPVSFVPPYHEARESPGEAAIPENLHQQLGRHHSMDEQDRSSSPSPIPASRSMRSPPGGHHGGGGTPGRNHPQSHQSPHFHQYPSPGHNSPHMNQHHQYPSHMQQQRSKEDYHREQQQQQQQHMRAMNGVPTTPSDTPHTPVPVRIGEPRTPSPRLSFTNMPPVKESVSWAI